MAKAKTSNIFVWILLGLLIVGLAGFGATNFGGSVRSVGSVGDTEIDVNAYARALDQELRALGAQRGSAVTLSEARDAGIDQMVLQRLVAQAALENEAALLGLSVGDERVSREILAIPAFGGIDGQFDREAYAFTLERAGLSVAEFEDRVRAETAASLVQAGVVGAVAPPQTYVDTVLGYLQEQRDVTWARVTPDVLTDPLPEPTEADLQAFYEANAAAFTLPETKVITYAWLTPDMIRDTVEIDRAALEARYQERIADFVRPERRLVERLVFGTEDEATAAAAAIEAGETSFDDLVAARGLTLEDVDLGETTPADLGDAGAAVFALTEPGVAGPLPSPLGPALFRMNAILSAQETTLDEAEEELRAELAADRARRVIDDGISEIDDLLAGGATLEEIAAETEMELGQIDWRATTDDGIAAYADFREAAAAVTTDDFPEVLTLEDGGIFALRLDAVRAPALQPLDDVRDAVIAGWEMQELTRRVTERAQAVADEIAAGREMAAIRLPIEMERGLTRDTELLTTPRTFVTQAFEMAPGELRVIEGDGAAFVLRLDAVRAADPADPQNAMLRGLFNQQAAQDIAGDILAAFTNGVIAQSGVQIDQTAINAVHAQFP
ncbi:peptidyl-prolyl cis-trans isomerase [Palleronia sp. KMU-117]|uniref:peptidylprolyl isomerase n=1 Tax=Palleronia sp. KMU-117 TaxID=3434108 RepID=UPI003D70D8F8